MDPIIGMIILWGNQRYPIGWFPCDGRQLAIQTYAPLYSLISTLYGGDGKTYFNLPDLRSRIPVGIGQGAGLSNYILAQKGGTEAVALTQAQIPAHVHGATTSLSLTGSVNIAARGSLPVSQQSGSSDKPGANLFPAKAPDYVSQGLTANNIYGAADGSTTMPVQVNIQSNPANFPVTGSVNVSIQPTGSSAAHSNIQPFLGLQYLIAWQGIYPNFD